MSIFPEGTPLWIDFAGTWYPCLVLPEGFVELNVGEVGIIYGDNSCSAVAKDLVEAFDKDYDDRMVEAMNAGIWDEFSNLRETFQQRLEALTAGLEATQETEAGDHEDDASEASGDDAEDDDGDDDEKARRAEKKAAKAEKKRLKKEAKEVRRTAEKEAKKAAKAEKKSKKQDDDIDELAALLDGEDVAVDASAADRSGPVSSRIRKAQITNGAHLEQPTERLANMQVNQLRMHYNTVLASEVAGANTRLMPFYERDYLATAERVIQRRSRMERFLGLSLKKAADEGTLGTDGNKAIKTAHEALRTFDLTKAFALPSPDPNEPRRVASADAVEVRSVPRGVEAPAGLERLKNVTRLYYRDQLTSIADGTSMVPVEPMPYRGGDIRRRDPAHLAQGLSQGSALLGGRFSSVRSFAPLLLNSTAETQVMTQWRLFRDLPPQPEGDDVQFIPPVGAVASRFDEAAQTLWQKAYSRAVKTLSRDDKLILNATAQTTETRLGLNIGFNDIPAAGGPPAGPEDVEDMVTDRDLIARQLRELGDTLDRERAAPAGKSQIRAEAALTFLELTQRAGIARGMVDTQTQKEGKIDPTQFNFHDFGITAAQKRDQRADMGSVEHGSGVAGLESVGSHLMTGSPVMENPLTPVNYGYDLDETYRSDVQQSEVAGDLRSLKSIDLPSVNSLWEQGSIAEGVAPVQNIRTSGELTATPTPAASPALEARKTVREVFLREAKSLVTSIEGLLSQSNSATFRSATGIILKQQILRDILEYLREVANVRTIVEKLTARAMEQLASRVNSRAHIDEGAPIVSTRESQQLRNSFRRQIERAHRLDNDALSKLVPTNVSRPSSDAVKSNHSEARSNHSRSTGISTRSTATGQRRSRERAYDE